MPRLPRGWILQEGLSLHKMWRGHNGEWNLKTDGEKSAYFSFLNTEIKKQESLLHAATAMSNHAHEVYQLEQTKMFSEFMRRHHARYGLFFNKLHRRRGKVAQDRPLTSAIENDCHEMETIFYIHANPVRAGIVKDAKDYIWSTHRLYAFGKREPWMANVVFPEWYLRLGKTMAERQQAYRKLFDAYLRERGLIKQAFSTYGIGSFFWIQARKETIRSLYRSRYGPSG